MIKMIMTLNISDFFFSTIPGYLLQTLPFAALAGFVFWFLKYRNDKTVPFSRKLWSVLVVCYIAQVICMVYFFSSIRYFWEFLFLGHKAENIFLALFRKGSVNLIPDFYRHFDKEAILNLILFMPFGVLYPLARNGSTRIRTVAAGVICIVCAEALQPIMGRTFAVNDLILNAAGLLLSSTLFFLIARTANRRNRIAPEDTE